ncbi:thermonuclease family protein [Sphingomonas hylomeconis]|uniref:Thermonuclease family protein n=1 Tax=Sphingomonas hylomeconis TaxID=1395958 RepID=A0ABV7SQZ7_9SPHN|nr:thermonuclease family protein [Sphingomonas hylomeconis]
MRYDYQWHMARARRRRGARKGAGIALMMFAGIVGGLALERALPRAPTIGAAAATAATTDSAAPRFDLCFTGGGTNCVVDGDTFWMAGEKIRIADIDTPETHPSRCALEADLGGRATLRLQALLNAGPVTLVTAGRDTDRYGRKLRVVERGGVSLGDILVAEGLARPWTGRRRPWCA